MDERERTVPVSGGSFLISDTAPSDVFTPEDLNEEQRLVSQTARGFVEQEGLPGLDRIAEKASALPDPPPGSDPMSIRTKAVRSPGGASWLLTGTKQFITNASFADVFTVFAKVDGGKHTAFLVDRDTEGFP